MFIFSVFPLKDEGLHQRFFISFQRPVLTLQLEDLNNQHLWIHLLRKHVHGRVNEVSTEDSEELLSDNLSLLPARTRPLRRLPVRALPWQAAACWGISPKRIRPVLLLRAAGDSAVLEICRLTVCRHADRVCTIASVRRRVGNAEMLVVVVECWCGAMRSKVM